MKDESIDISESSGAMLDSHPSISSASPSSSSPQGRKRPTSTTTKAARFCLDDTKIIEIPKSPADSFSSLYYDHEELAKFRHQAFLDVCDLVFDDDFLSLEADNCPIITLTYCTTQLNKG